MASVLQSVAAKRAAEVVGLTGLALIIKQVPYLLGLVCDGLGFVGNVLALQRLPLFLVQSIVAGSIGVTAVIASLRGAHLSWKDWSSLAVLGVGLIFLCVTAVPHAAARLPLVDDWIIVLTAMVPAVIGLIGFRMKGRASAIVMSCAAGLGFTGVAIASRGIGADDVSWSLLLNPLILAIIVHGAVGMSGNYSAPIRFLFNGLPATPESPERIWERESSLLDYSRLFGSGSPATKACTDRCVRSIVSARSAYSGSAITPDILHPDPRTSNKVRLQQPT